MNDESGFSRWMVVGRSEETGLGRLFADFVSLFPEMRQAVQPSLRFAQNPISDTVRRVPLDASEDDVAEILSGVEGIVLFETPEPPVILRVAKKLKLASVFVPMWEWFNPFFPDWNVVTRFACPNAMCERVLHRLGMRNTRQIAWPIDIRDLPKHQIRGAAKVFVHNSGIVEKDDRKAVHETIKAFSMVKGEALRLIVRTQNDAGLEIDDRRIECRIGHLASKNELYDQGDVLIQPSKAEGLGFAILEAMACGFPVITANYPPMNEYVPHRKMLAGVQWGSVKPVQAHYIPQAHLKMPRVPSIARCIRWCANHDLSGISDWNLQWAARTFDRTMMRAEWSRLLKECLSDVGR